MRNNDQTLDGGATAPESPHDPAYKVGPGHPPRQHQWRRGQSGNPKGRTKTSLDIATLIENALAAQVSVTQGGRRSTISKREATWIRLMNEGIKGDPSAIRRVFDLATKFGLLKRSLNPQGPRGGTIYLRKGHPYLTSNDPKDLASAIEEHENRCAEQERLERLQDGGLS